MGTAPMASAYVWRAIPGLPVTRRSVPSSATSRESVGMGSVYVATATMAKHAKDSTVPTTAATMVYVTTKQVVVSATPPSKDTNAKYPFAPMSAVAMDNVC